MLKRFLSDRRGVSAVEFALISPLLVMFYFATVEIDSMLTADRRVTFVSSTIADLVAQDDIVDDDELDGIFTAAAAIMAPYDTNDTIELAISSVRMDDDGDARVVWSVGHNRNGRGAGSQVNMQENILEGGATVIMAEASYSYEAPWAEYWDGALEMEETFYLRPRRSDSVCYVDEDDDTTC